jgi:hypothetical protein
MMQVDDMGGKLDKIEAEMEEDLRGIGNHSGEYFLSPPTFDR